MLNPERGPVDPTIRRLGSWAIAAAAAVGLMVGVLLLLLDASFLVPALVVPATVYVSVWGFILVGRYWMRQRRKV